MRSEEFIKKLDDREYQVCVVGLGYVGGPVLQESAKHFATTGYDISIGKCLAARQAGVLISMKPESTVLVSKFIIVAVPTPLAEGSSSEPDYGPLESVADMLVNFMAPGTVVVFESTVDPGTTRRLVEAIRARKPSLSFTAGYSPERINPGDAQHVLNNTNKIISAEDPETLKIIKHVYGKIVANAKLHEAPSMEVAEAAKIVENIQRDVNIGLMNELAVGFANMGISIHDVIAAASTKWNFLPFKPGLVGGHCVSVDPYYLIKAFNRNNQVQSSNFWYGQAAAVMSSARQASENFPRFLAESAYELMRGLTTTPKVLVVGCTFKEDIDDIRNSKVFDFLTQLDIVFKHNVCVTVVDDMADPGHVLSEYKHSLYRTADLTLNNAENTKFDLVFVNVQHKAQLVPMSQLLIEQTKSSGWVMDYKGTVDAEFIQKNAGIRTWGI